MKTGKPSRSPHSAKHKDRPSEVAMVCRLRVVSVMSQILARDATGHC